MLDEQLGKLFKNFGLCNCAYSLRKSSLRRNSMPLRLIHFHSFYGAVNIGADYRIEKQGTGILPKAKINLSL